MSRHDDRERCCPRCLVTFCRAALVAPHTYTRSGALLCDSCAVASRRIDDDILRARRAEEDRLFDRAAMAAREECATHVAALRRLVFARLRAMGFARESTSGASAYYQHGYGVRVRVSDHDVPMTAARENAPTTWANHRWSLVVTSDTTPLAAAQWLADLAAQLARQSR